MGLPNGLLVIGNLNIDRIYTVKALPSEGESTPISGEAVVYGGCGGNISSAAAKAGVDVRLSSVIGRDFPDDYIRSLERDGVDLSPVMVSEENPSPYCLILSGPGGKQLYAFNLGSMIEQSGMKIPVDHVCKYVHIATSDPEFSIRSAEAFKEMGSEVAIDPGMEIYQRWGKDQLGRVLPHCNRFFGNLGEWKYLGKILGWKDIPVEMNGIEVPHYLEPFMWIDEAVITLGSKGSLLMDEGSILHVEVKPEKDVVDATGAGDAFRGGFYGALSRGYSSHDALEFGNAFGALSVRSKGPQEFIIDWKSLLKMI